LKIFKTNDFAQSKKRYRLPGRTGQKHMIGKLLDDLSHVTIPAVQKRENGKLRQADNYGRLIITAG